MFPDFLCIGTQKAGTTWLHRNKVHQDAGLCPARIGQTDGFSGLATIREEQIEQLHRRFDNRYTASWLDSANQYLRARPHEN